jgi:hypothetical protein
MLAGLNSLARFVDGGVTKSLPKERVMLKGKLRLIDNVSGIFWLTGIWSILAIFHPL